MKLGVLSSLKKSLADSSRIVSDSRISSSFNEINLLETLSKHRPASQSYIGRLSLDQSPTNKDDSSKVVPKIPQLISENDELKQKIERLEQQLKHLHSTHNNSTLNKRHSFSFRQDNNKKDQHFNSHFQDHSALRNKVNKQSNVLKSMYSSVKNGGIQRVGNSGQAQSCNNNHDLYKGNEVQRLKQRIRYLQIQNELLRQSNEDMLQRYGRMVQIKSKHQQDIQEIVRSFQDTLKRKEELHNKQVSQLKQKIITLILSVQSRDREMEDLRQQNEKLRVKISQNQLEMSKHLGLVQQIQFLQLQMGKMRVELSQASKNYKLSETIEHLWSVKHVQYQNSIEIIESILSYE